MGQVGQLAETGSGAGVRNEPGPEEKLTFRQLRERAGLSQDELARHIGVTGKTVSNWERGISLASLTVPQMKALCQALGVTLDELPDDFG